jgi:hypothetical protein
VPRDQLPMLILLGSLAVEPRRVRVRVGHGGRVAVQGGRGRSPRVQVLLVLGLGRGSAVERHRGMRLESCGRVFAEGENCLEGGLPGVDLVGVRATQEVGALWQDQLDGPVCGLPLEDGVGARQALGRPGLTLDFQKVQLQWRGADGLV